MPLNPHQVTRDFEELLCEYTGAQHAVAVNSCTNALFLALKWHAKQYGTDMTVNIPRHTYVSVPMQILHAGFSVGFRTADWKGDYRLHPFNIYDSARYFSWNMWHTGPNPDRPTFICVSFHATKTLGIEQGGAILHNCGEAHQWFKRMRFDGRREGVSPKDDEFKELGYHMYMNPSTAAVGVLKLASMLVSRQENDPLPNDDYPDLSKFAVFRKEVKK